MPGISDGQISTGEVLAEAVPLGPQDQPGCLQTQTIVGRPVSAKVEVGIAVDPPDAQEPGNILSPAGGGICLLSGVPYMRISFGNDLPRSRIIGPALDLPILEILGNQENSAVLRTALHRLAQVAGTVPAGADIAGGQGGMAGN